MCQRGGPRPRLACRRRNRVFPRPFQARYRPLRRRFEHVRHPIALVGGANATTDHVRDREQRLLRSARSVRRTFRRFRTRRQAVAGNRLRGGLAIAQGIKGVRVDRAAALRDALSSAFASAEPVLIDVHVSAGGLRSSRLSLDAQAEDSSLDLQTCRARLTGRARQVSDDPSVRGSNDQPDFRGRRVMRLPAA